MDQPRNVYDEPQFFAGYSQMDRFTQAWGGGMEHADFLALLGEVQGARVLDLGCGAGQLAFALAEAGASEVLGVDSSEQMLAVGRERWTHPRVTLERQAMEEVDFEPQRFDVVVSSLALHYVRDYASLTRRMASWLSRGGRLVFSTEHPIFSARATTEGWLGTGEARVGWVVDHYAEEGLREHVWFGKQVERYHRRFSTLLNGLIDAGLTIERVIEPVPSQAWLRDHPEHIEERRRPTFMLVRASKP
jgi:ubiquinone/menaquinone biosynthesis C-methylase UbiE